jgi:hypothetical protein
VLGHGASDGFRQLLSGFESNLGSIFDVLEATDASDGHRRGCIAVRDESIKVDVRESEGLEKSVTGMDYVI